ncbi:MAG: glycosyltransferase [archaeon]|nr:glycosyltransferase [archaeon]
MDASVIVPAYNSQKTIAQCVAALMGQKFKGKFEVIVVDDGSSDETKKIAQKEGAKVFSQKNAGPAKARNLGAKNAKGKVLVFTDADCIAKKNWLTEMIAPFSDPKVAGVQGAYKTWQKSLVARFVQAEIEERYDYMDRHKEKLDWVGSYSAAYLREVFFGAKGFDESFPKASGEDPELSYKIAKSGKKLVFNRAAIVYHTHPNSVQKYFWTKFYRAFYRINLYSKHKDKILKDSYTPPGLKIQILAGYVGVALLFIIPILYAYGFALAAKAILVGNAILVFLATFFTLLSAWHAKQDPIVSIFSLVMIQVRTAAFMLGLPAGFLKKVLK